MEAHSGGVVQKKHRGRFYSIRSSFESGPVPGTYVCSLTARDEFGVNDPSPPVRTVTVQMATLQLFFTAPPPGSTVRGKTVQVSLALMAQLLRTHLPFPWTGR